jgi:hypothetical protein
MSRRFSKKNIPAISPRAHVRLLPGKILQPFTLTSYDERDRFILLELSTNPEPKMSDAKDRMDSKIAELNEITDKWLLDFTRIFKEGANYNGGTIEDDKIILGGAMQAASDISTFKIKRMIEVINRS